MRQLALFDLSTPKDVPIDREFFPTPEGIAEFAVSSLWTPGLFRPRVLDPGAGAGVWGQAVKKHCPAALTVGVDLPGVSRISDYNLWYGEDFRSIAARWLARENIIRFNLVVSNPPFSLFEDFAELACKLLVLGGTALFFGRVAMLGGQARGLGFWQRVPLRAVTVSSKRPSFTGDGKTDQSTEYAVFVFQKGYQGPVQLLPPFNYLIRETWKAVTIAYQKGIYYGTGSADPHG